MAGLFGRSDNAKDSTWTFGKLDTFGPTQGGSTATNAASEGKTNNTLDIKQGGSGAESGAGANPGNGTIGGSSTAGNNTSGGDQEKKSENNQNNENKEKPNDTGKSNNSLFAPSTNANQQSSTTNAQQTSSTTPSGKQFLPSRPSLEDVLTVAPSWKPLFEKVATELEATDQRIQELKSNVRTLQADSAQQREAVAESRDALERLLGEQAAVEQLAEGNHAPQLQRLTKQGAALRQAYKRKGKPPLVVPHGEYLRFLGDYTRRLQVLNSKAEALEAEIAHAERVVANPREESLVTNLQDVKAVLSLQLEQYKQLRLRGAALHDELVRKVRF